MHCYSPGVATAGYLYFGTEYVKNTGYWFASGDILPEDLHVL